MAVKNSVKAAGMAALQQMLQSFMPDVIEKLDALAKLIGKVEERVSQVEKRLDQFEKRFDGLSHEVERKIDGCLHEFEVKIEARINDLDKNADLRTHELEVKMYEKFDHQREVINELGQRINEVDTRLKTYIDITRDQTLSYKDLIERVVRMETLQDAKAPAKASRRRAS